MRNMFPMDWQPSVYTVPLAIATVLSAVLLVSVLRTRSRRGARSMLGFLLCVLVWTGCYTLKLFVVDTDLKILFHSLQSLGVAYISVAVLTFTAEYTNRSELLTRRNVALLLVFPTVSYLLFLTSMPGAVCDCHDLLIGDVATEQRLDDLKVLVPSFGPWFALFMAHNYGLLVVAVYFLVSEHRQKRSANLYRGQAVLFFVGIAAPWGISMASQFTVVDYTPIGFLVTGIAFAVAFFRFRLLDIVPIARGTAVETMKDGVIIVDDQERIVDLNPAAESIVGLSESGALGVSMDDIYEEYDELVADDADGDRRISLGRGGTECHYDVRISTIHDPNGNPTGRTLLVDDVTDAVKRQRRLERQKRELEAQNERLEEFASIVSHDLRNPINVIEGYTENIRATGDLEYVAEIERSAERMKEIIEDVLEMARTGQSVSETEEIQLAELCRAAWSTVDTAGGTLELDTTATIVGDRQRLRRLFENLFRNAIEHGVSGSDADGEGITVRVLEIEDGFAVEDDGPGIPEEDRDSVLDRGYTTAETGTGFGLSIVNACAEAHGWSLTVTEGSSGGARFEITGLTHTLGTDSIEDGEPDRAAPPSPGP
jgi:PAS domain S-box-containing protein